MEDPILRRRDRTPTITVRGDVAEGLQPPDVSAAISKALRPVVANLPAGYRIEMGDCAAGASDIEKAARLDPRNAAVHASLGVARLCAGDRDAARAALHRSLELDPSQATVRDYLKKLGDR